MAKVAGIEEVAVVGSGWMGSGSASVCSLGGYPVNLVDLLQDILDRCLVKIRTNMELLVEAGEASAVDADPALARIQPTPPMIEGLQPSRIAIEAVPGNLEAIP